MIEDDLRAVMLAHDHEAPTTDDLAPLTVRRGGRAVLPIAAAIAGVIALVATLVLIRAGSHGGRAAGRPDRIEASSSCPARVGTDPLSVPGPAGDPDALASLDTPDSVVVCAYLGSRQLTGENRMTGDLFVLVHALNRVSRGRVDVICAQNLAQTDRDHYLIRLGYGDRTVWVAAPGDHCAGSSNGAFTSSTNLRTDAEQAYRWGRWDNDPDLLERCDDPRPDYPQGARLPTDPSKLTICQPVPGQGRALQYTGNLLGGFVTEYNAAGSTDCSHRVGLLGRSTELVIVDYPDGTTAVINPSRLCSEQPAAETHLTQSLDEIIARG